MFDGVDPWMSDVDIAAGSRGLKDIEGRLTGTGFGIIVATQQNQGSPWLNFEAGALSKAVSKSPVYVAPLLVDIPDESQLIGPLQQFQCNVLTRGGFLRIIETLADTLNLEKSAVQSRFEALWKDLDSRFTAARETSSPAPSIETRDQSDLVIEILGHVRELTRRSVPAEIRTRRQSSIDQLKSFFATIDWDARTYTIEGTGDDLSQARATLESLPADPELIEHVKAHVLKTFDVALEVEIESATDSAPRSH